MKIKVSPLLLLIIIIVFFNKLTYSQDITSDLVSYFKFEETSGSVCLDETGENNGSINGSPTLGQQGIIGNCYLFGSSKYVSINYDPTLALNNYSISVWFKLSSSPTGLGYGLIGTRFGSDYTFDCKVASSNFVIADFGDGTAWLETWAGIYNSNYNLNQWYHVVYVANSSGWTAYLDGTFVNSGSLSQAPLFMKSDQELRIGESHDGEYMEGYIDELRIYNRSLTAGDVQALYDEKDGTTALAGGTISPTNTTVNYGQSPEWITSTTPASGGTGGYQYQWQDSIVGGTWTDISGQETDSLYAPAITVSTWYQRKVTDNSSNTAYSNTVAVTVNPEFDGGIISADITTVNPGQSPGWITSTTPASGGDGNYNYQWQDSIVGGTWTDISGQETDSLNAPDLSVSTWYMLEVSDNSGNFDLTNVIKITVITDSTSVSWNNLTDIPAGFDDGIDNVEDGDSDATNEIQDLSLSGNTLSLTGSPIDVDLSSISVTESQINDLSIDTLATEIEKDHWDTYIGQIAENKINSSGIDNQWSVIYDRLYPSSLDYELAIGTNLTYGYKMRLYSDIENKYAASFENVNSNGRGIYIKGGGPYNYSLMVTNYTGNERFSVSGSGLTKIGGKLAIDSENIFIDSDGTNNMTFTDPTAGTVTLSSLIGGSGGGSVVSVGPGNGMNFTSITTSGNVSMGTPSSITAISTNGFPSSGTHTHELANNSVTNAKMANDAVGIEELSASGTPSSLTYLRGDNTWATISSGGTDDQTASEVEISDNGGYFSSGNVEGALQEIGNNINSGGDGWGDESVVSDNSLLGNGTSSNPLKIDSSRFATQYDLTQVSGGTDDQTALEVYLNNYSTPGSGGDIGPNDNIQTAIGKLEYALDEATGGGGDVNVQSDWNQTDTYSDDYIKNKPIIPSGNQITDWTLANQGTIHSTNYTKLSESEVDNYVSDNGYLTSEVDGDPSNELQALSLDGNELSLSAGGGTVTLPSSSGTSVWNESSGIASYDGFVGIGTTSPDYELTVDGTIHASEVIVDTNIPTPDYVFNKNYDLKSLSEVESYIEEHSHLPEIPSAKEVEENGINLAEMNMLLLKKVEELTLYIIEQEKRIQELEKTE